MCIHHCWLLCMTSSISPEVQNYIWNNHMHLLEDKLQLSASSLYSCLLNSCWKRNGFVFFYHSVFPVVSLFKEIILFERLWLLSCFGWWRLKWTFFYITLHVNFWASLSFPAQLWCFPLWSQFELRYLKFRLVVPGLMADLLQALPIPDTTQWCFIVF